MMEFLPFLALLYLFVQSDATRCFECQNVPYPRDCVKVVTCKAHEHCYTEQVVTTLGNIVFNSGCLEDTRCSAASGSAFGKRSANIKERSGDGEIATCLECCLGDFCNNKGCGATIAPLGQRGPYCFNCDSVLDPKTCSDVAICDINEACNVVSSAYSNTRCPPSCCDTDFCNDQCGNKSVATQLPQTTTIHVPTQPATLTTTQQPVIVTSQASCKQDHYYDDITGMCIKIDETRVLNHDQAVKACEAIGDQLVTIDSHEKTVFIENMILRHSKLSDESKKNYYIGAVDKHDNGVFYWPDGQKIFYTNWGGGDELFPNRQPDGDHQNCVLLYGPDHYRWVDDRCENSWHFICEDQSTLKNIVHQTDPPPTHDSNTFHCNTHGGYIHLHRRDTHLCVHIVTQHANWDSAQAACKNEGGDLVVLDTTTKATIMEEKVNSSPYSSQSGYWIGAKDFNSNNHFSWVNGHSVTHGDWYPGQPNHHDGGHDQNCACLWSSQEHFKWHDDYCPKGLGYICERK